MDDHAILFAFLAEYQAEEEVESGKQYADGPDDDDSKVILLPAGHEHVMTAACEMLEETPLPGVPIHEAERKRQWLIFLPTTE